MYSRGALVKAIAKFFKIVCLALMKDLRMKAPKAPKSPFILRFVFGA